MFELLLCFALSAGLVRARRARHGWALLGGVAVAYLLAADTLAAVAGMRGPQPLYTLFNTVFLGPGAAPVRAPSWLTLPNLLLDQPLLMRPLRSLLSGAVAWRCLHESSKLNPLLPRAYALDGVAMPFVGAGVIDAAEGVLLLFALLLAQRG